VEKGNIGHIGVSNETAYGVMRFVQAAQAKGMPRIASIQNAYNLVNRTFEYGLAEACIEEDVSLLAYSPLGQGYLTGKYQGGALPAGSRKALFQRLGRYEGPGADGAIQSYLDLAAERGLSPSALAIAFCVSRSFMTSTIIGATSMAQLAADIDAAQTPWSDDLEKTVNALHARCPNPCP
jgi:aryl-alcohol dehydrogenase-like predicted oxidoreductase